MPPYCPRDTFPLPHAISPKRGTAAFKGGAGLRPVASQLRLALLDPHHKIDRPMTVAEPRFFHQQVNMSKRRWVSLRSWGPVVRASLASPAVRPPVSRS